MDFDKERAWLKAQGFSTDFNVRDSKAGFIAQARFEIMLALSYLTDDNKKIGFSLSDSAKYEPQENSIYIPFDGFSSRLETSFSSAGLKTSGSAFVFYHEISHKRLIDGFSQKHLAKNEFGQGLSLVVGNGGSENVNSVFLGKPSLAQKAEIVASLIQTLYQETYADVMAVHLSAKRTGDSPKELSVLVSKIRKNNEQDKEHSTDFGLSLLSEKVGKDEKLSKLFSNDLGFADRVALKISELNVSRLLKNINMDFDKVDSPVGKALSKMVKNLPDSNGFGLNLEPDLLIGENPKSISANDLADKIKSRTEEEKQIRRPTV